MNRDTQNDALSRAGSQSLNSLGLRLHHVGHVVSDLESRRDMYLRLGFAVVTPVVEDPRQRVRVQFVNPESDVLIELIQPATADSPVSRYLKDVGEGFHHLCYSTEDLEGICDFLRNDGGIFACPPVPAAAFSGRRIAFLYWNGMLVEFVETNNSGLTTE